MNHLSTDRGNSRASERLQRDLPVLFHLMDVSRQRPSAPPAVVLAPPPESHAPASEPLTPVVLPAAMPIAEPVLAEAFESAPEPVAAPPPPREPTDAAPVECTSPTKFSLDRPIELQLAPREPATDSSAAAESTDPPAISEPNAAVEHPVSPRPPFETRRRHKTPFSEDWFAAHGRYIAVVFVIALIGTVYLARMNRRPATTPIAQTPKADERPRGVATSASPAITVSTSPLPSSESSGPPKLVETTSAVTAARTELHAPSATEIASQTETASRSADNLFVFPPSKQAEERVAARPESPPAVANPVVNSPAAAATPFAPASGGSPSAMPNFAPPAVPPMPSAPGPSLAPTYPTTAAPPVSYPTTSPQQHTYPTTAAPPVNEAPGPAMPPRVAPGQPPAYQPVYPNPPAYPTTSTFQPQAGYSAPSTWQPPAGPAPTAQTAAAPGTWMPNAPGTWSPAPPSGGMPPQYQPPNNTASGFRNERTGSGLY